MRTVRSVTAARRRAARGAARELRTTPFNAGVGGVAEAGRPGMTSSPRREAPAARSRPPRSVTEGAWQNVLHGPIASLLRAHAACGLRPRGRQRILADVGTESGGRVSSTDALRDAACAAACSRATTTASSTATRAPR